MATKGHLKPFISERKQVDVTTDTGYSQLLSLNSSEQLAQCFQSFLPHESQAGSYKCSKDMTFQWQPVHTGLYISLPKPQLVFELETGAHHLWLSS